MANKRSYEELERENKILEQRILELENLQKKHNQTQDDSFIDTPSISQNKIAEQKFKTLVENAPVSIYLTKSDGRCSYTNTVWRKHSGLTLEQCLDFGWVEGIHPEDRELVKSNWDKMVESKGEWALEYRFIDREGNITWVSGKANKLLDDNDDIIGYVGTNLDITKKKKAEEIINTMYKVTVQNIGADFFDEVTKSLCSILGTDCTIIGEIMPDDMVHAISMILDQKIIHDYKYNLNDTPCNDAAKKGLCLIEKDVAALYPKDTDLVDLGAEGYFGVPIKNKEGEAIGVLCSISRKELHIPEYAFEMMETLAERISSEILRNKTEQALIEHDSNLTALIENMSEGLCVHEMVYDEYNNPVNYRITRVNSAYTINTGIDVQKVIGMLATELYGVSQAPFLEKYAKVVATGKPIKFESYFPPMKKYFEISVFSPGKDKFATIFSDITKRKEQESKLKESEQRFRGIIQGIRDEYFFYKHDAKGNFDFITESIINVLGYSVEEFSKHYSAYLTDNPINLESQKHTKQSLQGIKQPTYLVEIFHKNGNIRMLEVNETPVIENGKVVGVEGIAHDVTKRKNLEEQIRQSEKMEVIGQLAGGIAHDLNNQLTPIFGNADLIVNKCSANEELKQYATGILSSAMRSAALVKQLLLFARKDKGDFRPTKLFPVINEVGNLLKHTIDKRISINILYHGLSENESIVMGDVNQIQNLLLNIGLNARDAMEFGGQLSYKVTITKLVGYNRHNIQLTDGKYIEVTIEDTGAGIPKEHQKHIFEPFYTTKEVGKGTGMGLASVYGAIQMMGGAIDFTTEDGKGTSFKVYFPIVEQVVKPTKIKNKVIIQGENQHILLVEDEDLVRDMGKNMLNRLGYRCTIVNDGKSAIDIYNKEWQGIDLILLDMNMPYMNGEDTFYAMRNINKSVKAIVCSGRTDDISDSLRGLVCGIIQKPYSMSELSEYLSFAFGKSDIKV